METQEVTLAYLTYTIGNLQKEAQALAQSVDALQGGAIATPPVSGVDYEHSSSEGAFTPRALERPATSNGSLQADRYPGGTAGEEPEGEDIGNPDIQIPVVQNGAVRGSRREKTAKTRKQGRDAENGSSRKPDDQNSGLQEETLTTGKEAQKQENSATTLEGRGSSSFPDGATPPRDLRLDHRRPEERRGKKEL
ncbi:hypothetical protein NDU88_007621 [Pleurodeles waltl]|uniref:Uncharacterized protein n=1 Tax=Pleurodeles waltl TaxID=8319 RepID=A0AAV7RVL5_PLEWA|nr:hypothetical protein NDU88_007621 [Pleurodeles waltl]